jgi:serine phosphatase RsbU (regulator of sigma subunit)
MNATMPLGTLWAFCREARDFSDWQTNILEVVAGRLASDLDRQVLAEEALLARRQSREVAEAGHWQHAQLPSVAPILDAWEVAAVAHHARQVGGTFYDWFALDDGGLAVLAADTQSQGISGALAGAALRAAARAIGTERPAVEALFEKLNAILWTGSAGSDGAGVFHAVLDPQGDTCEVGCAGPLRVLAVSGNNAVVLAGPSTPLGWQERLRPVVLRHAMSAGELVVAYGASCLSDCERLTLSTLDAQLALLMESGASLPICELAQSAEQALRGCPGADEADRVVVLIRRLAK